PPCFPSPRRAPSSTLFPYATLFRSLAALSRAYPRKPGVLRLWLLHDPGAFRAIPEGEADLVLSGHTHGGHLGLLSLGLSHTIVRDRKSTRLNSSHVKISYAVFCLKK